MVAWQRLEWHQTMSKLSCTSLIKVPHSHRFRFVWDVFVTKSTNGHFYNLLILKLIVNTDSLCNVLRLWFRGGRSATMGLTFIPCPHWVLRPHLNCLTLTGFVRDFFSTKTTNGHFYNLLTCANLCKKPRTQSSSQLNNPSAMFSNPFSMKIVNKQQGESIMDF